MAESNFASSFLKDVGLSQYSTRFLEQGYEHFIDLASIDSKDLGYLICDQEHVNVILQAGEFVPDSCKFSVIFVVLHFSSFSLTPQKHINSQFIKVFFTYSEL
jgi:hypothetical protein